MKPEIILQSSLLDILFENRNKDYGAYTLRKEYSSRLTQSMLITFSIILFLGIIKTLYIEQTPDFKNSILIEDVHIRSLVEAVKPAEVKPAIPVQNKKIAQADNATVIIVPDNLADKQMKTQAELDTKLIGLADLDGDDAFLAPPIIPGEGSGLKMVAAEPAEPVIATEMAPLIRAEEMPEFPGGKDAFMKFMMRNLKEPGNLEEGDKIVVKVKFIVDAEGAIKSVEVLQSGGALDAEVLRVVSKMPRWKPGKMGGMSVPVRFKMPIKFRLQKN